MRTPKIEALHRLINWFNNKNINNIPLLGTDSIPLKNNSWLSGMLEADGSFYFHWDVNKNNIPINLIYYLRLSQKHIYTRRLDKNVNISNLNFMEQIADLFKTKVVLINRDRNSYIEKAYEIRTDKLESKLIMFNYLNKYPIFGYKIFIFENLEKIHNLILNKEHKTIEGKNKLEEYKNNMKNIPTKWSHLDNFYKN